MKRRAITNLERRQYHILGLNLLGLKSCLHRPNRSIN